MSSYYQSDCKYKSYEDLAVKFVDAFDNYLVYNGYMDAIDRMWDENPDNEVVETIWNAQYRVTWKAFESCVEILCEICAPVVDGFDAKAARAMIMRNEDQITDMVSRLLA